MTIGIYAIEHIPSGKKYVGKSLNIERRLAWHKYKLSQPICSKDCNRYLWNSVQKNGWQSFKTTILQVFDTIEEDVIAAAELHWMDHYKTCDREFGFNLRRDSSTGMITHPETRLALSRAQKARRETPLQRFFEGHLSSMRSKKIWEDMPDDKRAAIGKGIAERMQKYHYAQCDMRGNVICVWRSTREIIVQYPEIHIPNVHSVSDGYKGSYMGFIWEKVKPGYHPDCLYTPTAAAPVIDFSIKLPPTPRFTVVAIDPDVGPIEEYDSVKDAADAYGVSYGYMSNCVNGRVAEIQGYIFVKRDAPYIDLQNLRRETKHLILDEEDL